MPPVCTKRFECSNVPAIHVNRKSYFGTEHLRLRQSIERERARARLFKRETEHLCPRQPIHGIGRDPFARE